MVKVESIIKNLPLTIPLTIGIVSIVCLFSMKSCINENNILSIQKKQIQQLQNDYELKTKEVQQILKNNNNVENKYTKLLQELKENNDPVSNKTIDYNIENINKLYEKNIILNK